MPLYDFLAPAYDPALSWIFATHRKRALEKLPQLSNATVLDLACGTGLNFPLIGAKMNPPGKIIGLDISVNMLARAKRRLPQCDVSTLHLDAARLTPKILRAQTGGTQVDYITCTYGLTSMPARDWQNAFRASWSVLKPGGGYLIHDFDAPKRTLHSLAVETLTRSHFTSQVWAPLQEAATDFQIEYLTTTAHLSGARLFVAWGTK